MKVSDLMSVLKLMSPDAEINISLDDNGYDLGYKKGLAEGRSECLISVDNIPEDDIPSIDELEFRYIKNILKRCNNNKRKASKLLGINERTIYRKLKELEE